MKAALVCQILPNQLTHRYPISQAQSTFCTGLIESKHFCKVVSLVQTNILPYMLDEISDDRGVIYVQVRCFKQNVITRLFNNIIESLNVAKQVSDCDYVWFNNLNNQTILSYVLVKYCLRKKVFNIVTDYTPAKRLLSMANVIKYMHKKASGVISLSSTCILKNSNQAYLPGIILSTSVKKIRCDKFLDNKNIVVLFSGALTDVTGIELALKTFAQLPAMELCISGKGEKEQMVKYYSEKYHNIKYLGFVSYEKYVELLSKSTVCLSLRNPNLEENMNNFPSKIMEYLSYNKIVISTMKYDLLDNVKYLYSEFSVESLKDTLVKIENMSWEERLFYMDNRNEIISSFSENVWASEFERIEGTKY